MKFWAVSCLIYHFWAIYGNYDFGQNRTVIAVTWLLKILNKKFSTLNIAVNNKKKAPLAVNYPLSNKMSLLIGRTRNEEVMFQCPLLSCCFVAAFRQTLQIKMSFEAQVSMTHARRQDDWGKLISTIKTMSLHKKTFSMDQFTWNDDRFVRCT